MAISFNRDAQESTLNPLQISRIKLYNEDIFLLIMKRAEAMSRTHRELAVGSHLISEKGEGREKEAKAKREKTDKGAADECKSRAGSEAQEAVACLLRDPEL